MLADGTVFAGEWANGQQVGRWTSTYGDDMGGGFYAAGKRHGRWKLLFAASDDETVRGTAEGLYVAGNRNGLWVTRFDSGTVHEITWRHGVRHGASSSRFASGSTQEGPYVDGKKHGEWNYTRPNGNRLRSGEYVDGEREGAWREYGEDDKLREYGEYKEGKKHGHWTLNRTESPVFNPFMFSPAHGANVGRGLFEDDYQAGEWVYRFANGAVVTITYEAGSPNGPFSERNSDGDQMSKGELANWDKTGVWEEAAWSEDETQLPEGFRPSRLEISKGYSKGPYVAGERHGDWVLKYDNGMQAEGPYVDGERNGVWVFTYDRHATPMEEKGPFSQGKRNGFWTRSRVADGLNTSRITFLNGTARGDWKRTGEWVHRYSETCERGYYVEGQRDGRWVRRWLSDGRVSRVADYRGGQEHGIEVYPWTPGYRTEFGIQNRYGTVTRYLDGTQIDQRILKTEKQWRRWLKANPGVFPENRVSCDA